MAPPPARGLRSRRLPLLGASAHGASPCYGPTASARASAVQSSAATGDGDDGDRMEAATGCRRPRGGGGDGRRRPRGGGDDGDDGMEAATGVSLLALWSLARKSPTQSISE
jgi:hypothetical protein